MWRTNASSSRSPPVANIDESGNPHLRDKLVQVTVEVRNLRSRDGVEVTQLYVGIPNGPPRQLRGFEKFTLASGKSGKIKLASTRRDLSTWDSLHSNGHFSPGSTIFGLANEPFLDLPLKSLLNIHDYLAWGFWRFKSTVTGTRYFELFFVCPIYEI